MKTENPTQVAVLGLGYVGCVTAAGLASLGHQVLGIDRDRNKVENVVGGRAPFFEPGLEQLVQENVAAGRLSAATSADAVADADIALVCVGTPSEKNGNLGLTQLGRAVDEIAVHAAALEAADRCRSQHGIPDDLRRSGAARLGGTLRDPGRLPP